MRLSLIVSIGLILSLISRVDCADANLATPDVSVKFQSAVSHTTGGPACIELRTTELGAAGANNFLVGKSCASACAQRFKLKNKATNTYNVVKGTAETVGLQYHSTGKVIKRVSPLPSPLTDVDKLDIIEIGSATPKVYYIALPTGVITSGADDETGTERWILTGQAAGTVAETSLTFSKIDVGTVGNILATQRWNVIEP
jgi:hypothetical protein